MEQPGQREASLAEHWGAQGPTVLVVAAIKHLDQEHLKEERVYLAYNPKLRSVISERPHQSASSPSYCVLLRRQWTLNIICKLSGKWVVGAREVTQSKLLP